MKKILIASIIFLITGACLVAMNKSANQQQLAWHTTQALWLAQTQELAQTQAKVAALTTKTSDQNEELHNLIAVADPLAIELLSNDISHAPPELQNRLLERFGRGRNSTRDYVLVSKAALAWANVRPLKPFPNNAQLGDAARGILAITPDEQLAVETAFTNAYGTLSIWARENVQRDGADGDRLAQYAIPADAAFRGSLMTKLFSDVNAAIGDERGALLRKFYEIHGFSTDAAIGDRTNILAIYRSTNSPGYAFRAGWRWADNSEAINTRPDPIKPKNFPLAYRFIFPGGWPEVAQREGFELPPEFGPRE